MSKVGVAISTTGDERRMGFLENAVHQWDKVLGAGDVLFVTVDGTAIDCLRVVNTLAHYEGLSHWNGKVHRVGHRKYANERRGKPRGRVGVAINKNTGIEALMGAGVEHLFLCDDDAWPLSTLGLRKHIDLSPMIPHSMVCWGASRLQAKYPTHAAWTWPRGPMLYATRSVVEEVGGMDERFGMGGHEHVEWSRRIHQAGLTPDPFCTPAVYAEIGQLGKAMRAGAFWHFEDMRRVGEHVNSFRYRKRKLTTLNQTADQWSHAEKIMAERDGDTSFVAYAAHENGRASATLIGSTGENLTGLGAGGEK